mmetsp:Transcript_4578/g.9935  ORF Transcript_4578/g.9935 Transcript_4578/m.9935 type:complete len:205 (+) Transcript_4578:1026-1640(+)
MAFENDLAVLDHHLLDRTHELLEAGPVLGRREEAHALGELRAGLARASGPIWTRHAWRDAVRQKPAECANAASDHRRVEYCNGILREAHERENLAPLDELAWLLAIWLLRYGAELNENLVEVVMDSRHMQLHLQRVEDLHLNQHQLLQVVRAIADEDEVIHVRDHHLLMLARKAERADADELQPLARDFRGRHVPPHEVNSKLQ